MHVVVRHIARSCSWVPASELAWPLRIVIGIIVVVQGFAPGGNPALGVATGPLVAVSYVAPATDRAGRARVQRDADRRIAQRGLAGSLVRIARWQHVSASVEQRGQRISAAAAEQMTRSVSTVLGSLPKMVQPQLDRSFAVE